MSVVWCNGAIVDQLSLDPADRGLLLGDGVFETIAVRHARPVWLADHLKRMAEAARELGLTFDRATINRAITSTLQKSQSESEVLRITLTRGPTPRGFSAQGTMPGVIVSLNPLDRNSQPKAIRLATSQIRRNQTAPSSRLKTLSYIDEIAAAREVAARADDALMLNTKGNVASTTIANIFLLMGKSLITPSADQAILQGIARQKLLHGASQIELHAEARVILIEEIYAADCVFVTNSLRLATPVLALDGRPCGTRDISFIQDYYESLSKGEPT